MSRKSLFVGVGVSVVSAAAASAITWFVAKEIITREYEEKVDDEVRKSVDFILKQMGQENVVVSDEDPDILAEEMNDSEPSLDVEVIVEEPTVTEVLEELEEVNGERVFGSQESKPPLEDLAARNQRVQYDKILTTEKYDEKTPEEEVELPDPPIENPDISVISRDIFMENGTEWEQETLTYFADGGVLNTMGDLVEDHEKLIGAGRPRFGELSDDVNVVYLRNKREEKEYEVISDPGNASEFLMHSLSEFYRPSWQQE